MKTDHFDMERFDASGSTFKFGVAGRIFIVIHPAQNPAKEEWDALMQVIEKELPTLKGVFIYTTGGGPNAVQRKALSEMYDRHKEVPKACVTPSAVVRGVLTAMNLFKPNRFKGFNPDQVKEGLAFLDASPEERDSVLAVIDRYAAFIGIKK